MGAAGISNPNSDRAASRDWRWRDGEVKRCIRHPDRVKNTQLHGFGVGIIKISRVATRRCTSCIATASYHLIAYIGTPRQI